MKLQFQSILDTENFDALKTNLFPSLKIAWLFSVLILHIDLKCYMNLYEE